MGSDLDHEHAAEAAAVREERATRARLAAAWHRMVTTEDLEAILQVLVRLAREGDLAAADLVVSTAQIIEGREVR